MPHTSRLVAGVFGCLLLVLPALEAAAQTMEQALKELVLNGQVVPELMDDQLDLMASDALVPSQTLL